MTFRIIKNKSTKIYIISYTGLIPTEFESPQTFNFIDLVKRFY